MPKSFLSRKVYLGIPFYERRKPIDFVSGLEQYKAGIREQVIAEATPTVTNTAVSAVTAALSSFMAPKQRVKGYGSISSGAGYSGGTSASAKAILSAASKAKAQSINKSTSKKKR